MRSPTPRPRALANFPYYRRAGPARADRPPVLVAVQAAAELVPRERPIERSCSVGVDGRAYLLARTPPTRRPVPALGLALLGYPCTHPAARNVRVEHFPRLTMPMLRVADTQRVGAPAELKRHAKKVKGPVTFYWVETGDHSVKPLKASGLTADGPRSVVSPRQLSASFGVWGEVDARMTP